MTEQIREVYKKLKELETKYNLLLDRLNATNSRIDKLCEKIENLEKSINKKELKKLIRIGTVKVEPIWKYESFSEESLFNLGVTLLKDGDELYFVLANITIKGKSIFSLGIYKDAEKIMIALGPIIINIKILEK